MSSQDSEATPIVLWRLVQKEPETGWREGCAGVGGNVRGMDVEGALIVAWDGIRVRSRASENCQVFAFFATALTVGSG